MRVLVTGATGAVGPRVVEALIAAGYAVRALVRRAPAAVKPYLRLARFDRPATVISESPDDASSQAIRAELTAT